MNGDATCYQRHGLYDKFLFTCLNVSKYMQKQNSDRALMPPPQARFESNSRKNLYVQRNEMPSSSRNNTSNRRSESSYNARASAANSYSSQSSNLSSNSDAHKPKRKRRPKKKKQQVGLLTYELICRKQIFEQHLIKYLASCDHSV